MKMHRLGLMGLALMSGCRHPREAADLSPPPALHAEREAGGVAQDVGIALRERLAPFAVELTQPPFGTAAAMTALSGTEAVTLVAGSLHEAGLAVDENTLYNVASVSKLLTAARVVSLAHAGKLQLDDALDKHLPGVRLIDESGADQTSSTTLRDLLQHRSGVPHFPPDLEAEVGGEWTSPSLLQKLTDSWTVQLVGPPGEYRYSNLGYALLGAVIERTQGCTFADCMEAYLDELGMERSTFWPANLTGNAAHGRVEVEGTSPTFHAPGWYGSRYALPFTGLWTTAPELAAFGAHLSAASRDSASPLHEMTTGSGHGLGVIHGMRLGNKSLEHDGSAQGFFASLIVVPERETVHAVLTNGGRERPDEVKAFARIVAASLSALADP